MAKHNRRRQKRARLQARAQQAQQGVMTSATEYSSASWQGTWSKASKPWKGAEFTGKPWLGGLEAEVKMDVGRTSHRPFFTKQSFSSGFASKEGFKDFASRGAGRFTSTASGFVDKTFRVATGEGKWYGKAMRDVAKRPNIAGILAIAALTVGVGGKMAATGTKQSLEMNRMYVAHNNAQRQAANETIPVNNLGRQVTPTFSGRRVSGGHMGATGDLVFAMNRRR